jgi:hypothetical protein
VTVPACAQTGPIAFGAYWGSATNSQIFTVGVPPTPPPYPPPKHRGITPSSGPIGTLVTLTGTNLTLPGVSAEALFTGCNAAGTVPATPQVDGTLTVTVPACAQTGPITVITSEGSSTSAQSFTVG